METWLKIGGYVAVSKRRNLFFDSRFIVNRLDTLRTHLVVMFLPLELSTDHVPPNDHPGGPTYATNAAYYNIVS